MSEFSKRTLTFNFDNWDDGEYAAVKDTLIDFVKKTFNDVTLTEKTDCLYDLDKS